MANNVFCFSLFLNVTDTTELWHRAAERAYLDGAFETEEDYRAAHPEDDISTHLRMLLDPGLPPRL